jgi:hypothetical protein
MFRYCGASSVVENRQCTSVDPLTASATIRNPQTFNRYAYALNSPYKFTDPLGLIPSSTGACGAWCPGGDSGSFGSGGGHDSSAADYFESAAIVAALAQADRHTNEAAEPIDGTPAGHQVPKQTESAPPSVEQKIDDSNDRSQLIVTYLPSELQLAKKILDIIYFARDSIACKLAFESIGATPVVEQVKKLRIVTQSVFSNPELDYLWAPDKEFADALRAALMENTSWAAGVTTNDITQVGAYSDGWRYIGLTNRGLRENDVNLATTIIHSLIHSGGISGKNSQTWGEWFWGIRPHDLRYLGSSYDAIIKACTK